MKKIVSVIYTIAGFSLLFSACGGEGEQAGIPTRRIVSGGVIVPTSTPTAATLGGDSVIATNAVIFASDGAVQTLTVSDGYNAQCNSNTAITWTFASTSAYISVDNPTACNPKLTILSGYDGKNSIDAVLKLSNKTVHYHVDIKKYNPTTGTCQTNNGTVIDDKCVFVGCAGYATDKCIRAAYELDGRDEAQATANAKAICAEKKSFYFDHNIVQKSISCGSLYAVSNWNGSAFVSMIEPLCYLKSVKIINQVRCY